jgi:plasmid stabilization system protein ParE
MRLRFTPRAVADLDAIADYLSERNPAAALRVRTAILRSLERLVAFPESGRRQSVDRVRKLVVGAYPYLVYYTVDALAGEIVVLTIQHPSRERGYEDL